MATNISIEVVKKIDFEQKAEDFREAVIGIAEVRSEQMTDAVRVNILANDNIDTSTLLDKLETKVTLSPKGHAITLETASNVSSHPEGHSGYAPVIEYGSGRTRAYHNFVPAMELIAPLVFKDLKKIRL